MNSVFSMFPRLNQAPNEIAAHLSGGEQQMLAIGRDPMGKLRLPPMDEPSEGTGAALGCRSDGDHS